MEGGGRVGREVEGGCEELWKMGMDKRMTGVEREVEGGCGE